MFTIVKTLLDKSPFFLASLKGKKANNFYHYSLTGDYLGERVKWGAGNSAFFMKISYCLGRKLDADILAAAAYLNSFQNTAGDFVDWAVVGLAWPGNFIRNQLKSGQYRLLTRDYIVAETRQALSALTLYNLAPRVEKIVEYFDRTDHMRWWQSFDWSHPWHSGSHVSHRLFFLARANDGQAQIKMILDSLNNLRNKNDGFWYQGAVSEREKINGAMKVLTGLAAVGAINRENVDPEKLIDGCLNFVKGENACDNFNVVYVLRRCYDLTSGQYRAAEIRDFFSLHLNNYKQYFYPEQGAFSFYPHRAGRFYYGAPVSRGKAEPDIHGTALFLWGLSLISPVLATGNTSWDGSILREYGV